MESLRDLNLGSSTPPSPSISLPTELLIVIFNLVQSGIDQPEVGKDLSQSSIEADDELGTGSNSTNKMLPLTLVCRDWYLPSITILYRDIEVNRINQFSSLLTYSTRCLPLIRSLRVAWNRQPWIVPDPDLLMLPAFLNASPNISAIVLAGEQFDLSSLPLLDAFSQRSDPSNTFTPITSLSCCSLSLPYFDQQRFGPQNRRTSAVLDLLLAALPDLKEARFDEFRSSYSQPTTKISCSTQANTVIPLKICKLVLEKTGLESGYLSTLFLRVGSHLRELSLHRVTLGTIESWREILETIGGQLEVLEMKECDFWSIWEDENNQIPTIIDCTLASCPRLKSLTLTGSLDSRPPLLVEKLPNLRVLTIGSRLIKADSVENALRSNFWPQLQRVLIFDNCEWSLSSTIQVYRLVNSMGISMGGRVEQWNTRDEEY